MQTVKLKTSELIGKALNWAVEQLEFERIRAEGEHVKSWWFEQKQIDPTDYSTDGERVMYLLKRGKIGVMPDTSVGWIARGFCDAVEYSGATPEIAVLRCYAAAHYGEETEVPAHLLATHDVEQRNQEQLA